VRLRYPAVKSGGHYNLTHEIWASVLGQAYVELHKTRRIPIHTTGARPDPPRDGHALRLVSGAGQWPIPAHLAGRTAAGQAQEPEGHSEHADRGLVRIGTNPMGRPAAFFTQAGLEALRQLLQDRRAMDPARFAHLRQELGMDALSDNET
jgi:hypothetical protein